MKKHGVIHLTCMGWHALSEGLSMRRPLTITCSGFARACHPTADIEKILGREVRK